MMNIISRQVLTCNNTTLSTLQDTPNYVMFLMLGRAANAYIIELDVYLLLSILFMAIAVARKIDQMKTSEIFFFYITN